MPRHPLPDDDVDPTGVRELLAALPDPGPMPEDLVRRIEARLEVERAHLGAERAGSAITPADNVLDLAAERTRRRPIRTAALIGVAAGGLMVTTVTLTQFLGPGGGMSDTAAVYPSRAADPAAAEAGSDGPSAGDDSASDEGAAVEQEDSADTGGPPAAALEADRGAQTEAAADEAAAGSFPLAPTKELQITVLPAVPPVTADNVSATLWEALQDDDVRFSRSDLSVPEAESCWRLLAAEHDYAGHVATKAQFVDADGRGTPAVALLGLHHDDTGEAWIMPTSCTQDSEQTPLSGPHPLH